MTETTGSRRVLLKGAAPPPRGWWVSRSLWVAGALAVYAVTVFFGWPLLEGRVLGVNALAVSGEPATPALIQTGLAFMAFGFVALVALALCWRRQGIRRVAVLATPLAMLAIPEAARLLPGPWVWIGCPLFGVLGVALIAGNGRASGEGY